MEQVVTTTRSRRTPEWAFRGFFAVYLSLTLLWLALAVGSEGSSSLPSLEARVGDYLFSAVNLAVAFYLLERFRDTPTARFLAVGMVGTAAAFNLTVHQYLEAHQTAFIDFVHISFLVIAAGAYACGLVSLLLSMDGSQISVRRFCRPPRAGTLFILAVGLSALFYWIHRDIGVPFPSIVFFLGVVMLGFGAVSQGFHAFAQPQDAEERDRRVSARIFLEVLALCFLLCSVVALLYLVMSGQDLRELRNPIVAHATHPEFAFIVLSPLLTGLPVALFFATRRGPRALLRSIAYLAVYSLITFMAVAVHVLFDFVVKGRVAARMHLEPHALLASALTTLLAVTLFEPLREAFMHAVHWWAEEAADDWSILPRISRKLGELDGVPALNYVAEQAARATRARRARAILHLPSDATVTGTYPTEDIGHMDGLVTNVTYGDAVIGAIEVGHRPWPWRVPKRWQGGRPISRRGRRLLGNVADVSGLVFQLMLTSETRERPPRAPRQHSVARTNRRIRRNQCGPELVGAG